MNYTQRGRSIADTRWKPAFSLRGPAIRRNGRQRERCFRCAASCFQHGAAPPARHGPRPLNALIDQAEEPQRLDETIRVRANDHRCHIRIGTADDGCGLEVVRSEEHTSELQSRQYLVCRLLLEKKKTR